MPDPISWLIIIICILLSFFFSASETALACCNRFKLKIEADEGHKSAKLVLKTCEKFDRALTAVLIGNNVVAVAISALATILFLKYFNGILDETWISIICSIIMSFVVYIIGDTLPKTIAKAIPDTMSKICIYPVQFFIYIFFPFTILFESVSKLLRKIFKTKVKEEISEEDLTHAVEKASQDETIEEEQVEMVQSAFDFIDTKVKEVLTPKDKIVAINIKNLSHKELKRLLSDIKYSRIPMYEGTLDNIIGVLNVKVYFKEVTADPHVSVRSILQKPYFVNENVLLDDLFEIFKKKHTHIAFVRDSNKTLIGMVTMEDVLEELISGIDENTSTRNGK